MFRKILVSGLVLIFILCVGVGKSFAEVQEVEATGEYTYGDRETRADAKHAALEDAKRNALEKVIVQVKAYSNMKNFNLVEDDIRSYTAGRMRIIDREFEFVGVSTCIATIKAVIEFDLEAIKNAPHISATTDKNATNNQPVQNPAPQNLPEKLNEILDGATEWNGHYYKIFPMPIKWENAKKFCDSVGGHLATAETKDENEFIKQLFMKYKGIERCWIGAYRDDAGIWHWITDKIIASYFDWGNGEPRVDDKLTLARNIEGKWATELGTKGKFFMCEWEKAADAHESNL